MYRIDDWGTLTGAWFEMRLDGCPVRLGFIDEVMPDSSVLWIAADGVHSGTLFEPASGDKAFTYAQPRVPHNNDMSPGDSNCVLRRL
jgi:hypothetical protein